MLETDTLFPFAAHPFLVKDNEDLTELIQSIKDVGILIPVLVRVHPAMKGKFEILAGHRRHTAASSIGIKQVPMKGVCQQLECGRKLSERNIRRYIRLNYLIPELLEMVDNKKIALFPAMDLSFLIKQEQETVFRFLDGYTYTMDGKKAETLKQCSRDKKFSVKVAEDIITGRYYKKPAKKATAKKHPIRRNWWVGCFFICINKFITERKGIP